MTDTDRTRGSVTVEAAIAFPLFLCIIVSIIFLVKVVRTHEIIQHAINGAANEMASAAYIYQISGLREIHDTARDGIKDKAQLFKEHADEVLDAYQSLKGLAGNQVNEENAFEEAVEGIGSIAGIGERIADDPLEVLKSAAFMILEGEFDEVKTELFIPLAKAYMKKYLASDTGKDVDEKLKKLNVSGGFEGLDFGGSSFLADENNDIEIVVRYKIELPLPMGAFDELFFVQRAVAKAWLDGDGSYNSAGDGSGDDIWSLNNFLRGARLRLIYGANLPQSFPTIARFAGGKATMIKSMDLTADSYQDPAAVADKVEEYLDRLCAFEGQEEPWGRDDIVIRKEDIRAKELLLVIPGNPIKPDVSVALERCEYLASSRGVALKIEVYGYKKEKEADSELENP